MIIVVDFLKIIDIRSYLYVRHAPYFDEAQYRRFDRAIGRDGDGQHGC